MNWRDYEPLSKGIAYSVLYREATNILSREFCVQDWSLLLSYARIFTMGVVSFLVRV
jgi:hypothetical protein